MNSLLALALHHSSHAAWGRCGWLLPVTLHRTDMDFTIWPAMCGSCAGIGMGHVRADHRPIAAAKISAGCTNEAQKHYSQGRRPEKKLRFLVLHHPRRD